MSRYDQAMSVIASVHDTLPDDISLKDRTQAIDAAYPFGQREYHPYKQWLKARRAYLCRYGYKPRNAPRETPMERAMRRGKESVR